jgi:hypothetical protein
MHTTPCHYKDKSMESRQIGEVSRWGGWRGSPNSIATLMRYRIPWSQQRRCKACQRIAVRGYDTCIRHLGRRPLMSAAFGRGERRLLARLERRGLLPSDLMAMPAWRDLGDQPCQVRAPMRLALLQAWDKRQAEPLQWAKVQRQALRIVRGQLPGAAPGGVS